MQTFHFIIIVIKLDTGGRVEDYNPAWRRQIRRVDFDIVVGHPFEVYARQRAKV